LPETNEEERLQALYKYDLLSLPPVSHFDHIVALAAKLFDVPIAMVSLVDKDNIWFKSSVGVSIPGIERTAGLCASAILSDDIYMVEDALKDERTVENPLVSHSGLRFYAAAPLKVKGGFRLGNLCLVDKKPGTLTQEQKDILNRLAAIIVDEMELRLESNAAETRQNKILSVAAHELKNSLTTISAYAELLKEKESGSLSVEQISNHLTRACNRMNNLIKEMFDLTRLHTDSINLHRSFFDIAPIIGRVAARNTVLAGAKQQKLFLDIASNIMVHADITRIEEIADNLINNAIKYSPPGTAINIKLQGRDKTAVLEVEDEGPGFTEADRQRLFMPFSKLSARPTGGETSTGIGLCVVKMLVDAHGGKVVLKNNTEKSGAKFTVTIPAGSV
jgi:signal transduction histidine kinase